MLMNKRDFLRHLGTTTLAAALGDRALAQGRQRPPAELAADDEFWALVRRNYRLSADYVNLENGYYSMQAQPVLDAFLGHVRDVNFAAARYMRTRQVEDKQAARTKLAALAGCSPDELIITRNTTESLDTVISGFDWQAGDEAVMAAQDYGAMLQMFRLMARRHGMVNKIVSLPRDPSSDDQIVDLYARAITAKTKLLMVCHMVNITGQILPVRKIAAMAHARGVPVMVDGAHAFAHLDFAIPDLDADYYGASLHKWLGCPLGAGILYVRRDRIRGLWPLFGDGAPDDDVRKLNHTGTHPAHTDLAILDAIAWHESLGAARKEARLRHLQQYWTDQVRGTPGLTLCTPRDPARACAIATVGVDRLRPKDLAEVLFERYRIFVVAIDYVGVHGVRVTPHVFTTKAELDALVRALRELAAG
jgi:selenocysteine lyase/cysteine desulfurase